MHIAARNMQCLSRELIGLHDVPPGVVSLVGLSMVNATKVWIQRSCCACREEIER
jgi:hypothetical protein